MVISLGLTGQLTLATTMDHGSLPLPLGGGKNHDFISTGVIPRSLLRRDSRVGSVRIDSAILIVSFPSQFSRLAQISPEVEDSRLRRFLAPRPVCQSTGRRQDAKGRGETRHPQRRPG